MLVSAVGIPPRHSSFLHGIPARYSFVSLALIQSKLVHCLNSQLLCGAQGSLTAHFRARSKRRGFGPRASRAPQETDQSFHSFFGVFLEIGRLLDQKSEIGHSLSLKKREP